MAATLNYRCVRVLAWCSCKLRLALRFRCLGGRVAVKARVDVMAARRLRPSSLPALLLHRRHVFGVRNNVSSNLHYVDENVVVYPAGHNVVKYSMDSKLQEFINGSDSTLAITTVAVSASKRSVVLPCSAFYLRVYSNARGCFTVHGLAVLPRRACPVCLLLCCVSSMPSHCAPRPLLTVPQRQSSNFSSSLVDTSACSAFETVKCGGLSLFRRLELLTPLVILVHCTVSSAQADRGGGARHDDRPGVHLQPPEPVQEEGADVSGDDVQGDRQHQLLRR